jgi:molybdopterin molybdotransferase
MLSVDAAQNALLAMASNTPAEQIEPSGALGRILANPMIAERTKPPCDVSSMDGYAMRLSDGIGPWQMVPDPAQHDGYGEPFPTGSTMRIFTGSALPVGADAILVQENAARDGDLIFAQNGAVPVADYVRKRGMDFQPGYILHPAGTRIGAAHIALAIAAGLSHLTVHKRPKVSIVSTGNELCLVPADPRFIPDTNGPMLANLVHEWGGAPTQYPPINDVLADLISALETAQLADIIVSSGGTSVGDYDLLMPALRALGAEIAFWKITMRPGKPLIVAKLGRAIILGLPGNPVSAFVTAHLFLRPLMRKMMGCGEHLPAYRSARLGCDLPNNGPRAHYMRAILQGDTVQPLADQDSSLLHTLSQSNCLICRDIDAPKAAKHDDVSIIML